MMSPEPWLVLLLCSSLSGAWGLTSFPDNLVLGKRDGSVRLSCTTELESGVTWRRERGGVSELLQDTDYQYEGHDLHLTELDTPLLGIYSCWDGDTMLASTHLLLKEDEGESLLSCRARTYGCSFQCSWSSRDVNALRLGMGLDCLDGDSSCPWVLPDTIQASEEGYTFTLHHPSPASFEETSPLLVTAEAVNNVSYFKETKQFFLRDIVQPDSPRGVNCLMEKQRLKVTVEAASSWATPLSFYPLEHEIEYLNKDNGGVEQSRTDIIPKEVSQLRVRSRDPLVPSPWSQWSSWKNVQLKDKKKRGCKGKGKDIICCRRKTKNSKKKT